jgi:hypothetical protein
MIVTINNQGTFTSDPQRRSGDSSSLSPSIPVRLDLTAQAANIAPAQLYAVPVNAGGLYRVAFYIVLTQVATTSSTLPYGAIGFTDADVGATESAAANSGNTLGLSNGNGGAATMQTFNVKPGTNITYSTSNYASSGATPMQYAVHLRLEYLG